MSRSFRLSFPALLGLLAFVLPATRGVVRPAIAAANDASPATVRIEPKALPYTLFEFEGRVEITNRDATFDVPPAYQKSFSFWIDRLKGVSKSELVQFLWRTEAAAEDGSVPFRKQVPRYYMEITRPGKLSASASSMLYADVKQMVWNGTLDRYGRVREMSLTKAPNNDEIKNLGFPILHHLLTGLDGPHEMKVGDSFTLEETADLPSRLTIRGLEEIGLVLTRTYTLKGFNPDTAEFAVDLEYAADPQRPPQAERTTCAITGSGTGGAVFDLHDGVFVSGDLRTLMTIDIEAPLRRLPEQGENEDPGTGTTRLVLQVNMKGKQTVSRLRGDDAGGAPESGEPN